MAVYRINKTDNYTVLSNTHLKDKTLSLKAKGLLTMMLSLPDDWRYSINGLVSICKESETAVGNAVNELKEHGYIKVTKSKDGQGKFFYIYDVYENPQLDNPVADNPGVENLGVDNPGMENLPLYKGLNKSNTKEQNTKKINTEYKSGSDEPTPAPKKVKHKYGEYEHVLLTDKERDKLFEEKGEVETLEAIKYLDEYIEMYGKKYKNHNLVLRKWVFDAVREKKEKKPKQQGQAYGMNPIDWDSI